MKPASNPVPQHRSSPWIFAGAVFSVLTSAGLILTHAIRVTGSAHWTDLWLLLVVLAAWPAADFASGLVHWLGDTWGTERWPFLGPRFIRPFRVHHVNPQGMLESSFFDTNGDSALVTIPLLLAVFAIPLDGITGRASVTFLTAFCFWGMPTNQIHFWAHHSHPPRWVAWLQQRGLIISPEHHLRHHSSPFAIHYCITTGWCNTLLDRIRFFRVLELVVRRTTGAVPRCDDEEYAGGGQAQ
jgi:plasmanylethanolamine desaturase